MTTNIFILMFKLLERIQCVDKQCCRKLAYYLSVHRLTLVANLTVFQELPVLILKFKI